MIQEALLDELKALNREEKLRVVQILVNELADNESILDSNAVYEVWSPQDDGNVAETLMQLLEEAKEHSHA
jgi:hypothetical protein